MRCLWNGIHPCGKCPACFANRQRAFMFRLDKEKDYATFYYWLTLQYDPEHVPRTSSGDMCFNKKHCRLFFEHIRIKFRDIHVKFKHFLVSEYGGNGTKRPHYHCLLLVYCSDDMTIVDKYNLKREMREYLVYQAWRYGHVTEKSYHGRVLSYLTKYCCKPELVGDYHEMSPFTLISPGLGERYLETLSSGRLDQMKSSGDFSVRYGNSKIQLPRYYIDKLLPCSRSDRFKAYEDHDFDRLFELEENRKIRHSSNMRQLTLRNDRLKQMYKSNDIVGMNVSELKHDEASNREYSFDEFRSKIKNRKDL